MALTEDTKGAALLVAKILDGKSIAVQVREEVAVGVEKVKSKYCVTPTLSVIQVGTDPASTVYVQNKRKAALKVGMNAHDVQLPTNISQDSLISTVKRVSEDHSVHGILIQLPLPPHIDSESVIESISPEKDVDGLHPVNVGLLCGGRPQFIPATPAGIQEMLLQSGYVPDGQHVVICGRSNIVGKPVAMLLMQRKPGANATVTICHSRTKDLARITRQADILIAAVAQPLFITADMIKSDAVIVDVGINRMLAPDRKSGYRVVGDVDFDGVFHKASAISPVPGGVGPMTIAMLLKNTLAAAHLAVGSPA